MPQYPRDPNALAILLGAQPKSYAGYGTDDELAEMIPEEDLYGAQEDIGATGQESGRPYFIPSRESLKRSGVSGLKRIFGEIGARGEAAALPRRVAGEYGLRQEGIRQEGQLRTAEARAREAAANREAIGQQALERQTQAQGFTSGERAGREQFASGENRLNRESRAAIERERQAAIGARAKKPGGLFDFFSRLLGRGPESEAALPPTDDVAISNTEPDEDVAELDLTPEQFLRLQQILEGR